MHRAVSDVIVINHESLFVFISLEHTTFIISFQAHNLSLFFNIFVTQEVKHLTASQRYIAKMFT